MIQLFNFRTIKENLFDQIAHQWDINLPYRVKELENHEDLTYFQSMIPVFKKLLFKYAKGGDLIDVGCGLGFLSAEINAIGYDVIGIDISKKSIEYAKTRFRDVEFLNLSIVSYSNLFKNRFDVCTSNMVFHNTPSLNEDIECIFDLLKPGGILLISIPHPCFWYRKHSKLKYNLNGTESYRVKFKINRGEEHPSSITFFQRSIKQYLNLLVRAGFEILELDELNFNLVEEPGVLIIVCIKN